MKSWHHGHHKSKESMKMGPFCVIINLDIFCRFDSKHLEVTIHFKDLKCMKYVVPEELLAKAKAKKSEKPFTLHKGYALMDCFPMFQKLWDLVLRVKVLLREEGSKRNKVEGHREEKNKTKQVEAKILEVAFESKRISKEMVKAKDVNISKNIVIGNRKRLISKHMDQEEKKETYENIGG
ncbi:hypothetical protein ACFE04_020582 [Oxalis oulophora]